MTESNSAGNPASNSENPFGGLDLGAMLEQAQQMQAQLMAAQQQLAESSVTGTAGGVTVTLDGTGELTGVAFAPDAVAGTDAESLTDLADLVVAAYRDARSKAESLASERLGPITGGLGGGLPGGGPLV